MKGNWKNSLKQEIVSFFGLSKPNASGANLSLLDLLETSESLGKFDSFLNGFWLF
jgi:hypothetical protein